MRVYISADMEGASGIAHPDQVIPDGSAYAAGCDLVTDDVNAAVGAAQRAGAREIIVSDAHHTQRNIVYAKFQGGARLVSGSQRTAPMLAGLDATCDAAILLGYHARAGTPNAVMDHTYLGQGILAVRLNSMEVGEIGLNAAYCGAHGVPVVCVTGDAAAAEEAARLLPGVVTVAVKQGVGRFSAICEDLTHAHELIAEGVAKGLASRDIVPWCPAPPYVLEVDVSTPAIADLAAFIPGTERVSPRTIRYRFAGHYVDLTRAWRTIYTMAAQGLNSHY